MHGLQQASYWTSGVLKKYLSFCTATTRTGNLVSTMTVKEHFDNNYTVYDFRKEYEPQQMTDYKILGVNIHSKYMY